MVLLVVVRFVNSGRKILNAKQITEITAREMLLYGQNAFDGDELNGGPQWVNLRGGVKGVAPHIRRVRTRFGNPLFGRYI